jgi:hypothetical protein
MRRAPGARSVASWQERGFKVRTIKELAEQPWESPSSFRRRATALKRLATGLQSVASPDSLLGLSAKEHSDMAKALALVRTAAQRLDGAAKQRGVQDQLQQTRAAEVGAQLRERLLAITQDPRDLAAFVLAAGRPWILEDVRSRADLDAQVREAAADVARVVIKQSTTFPPSAQALDAVFAKFAQVRGALEVKYRARLEAALLRLGA